MNGRGAIPEPLARSCAREDASEAAIGRLPERGVIAGEILREGRRRTRVQLDSDRKPEDLLFCRQRGGMDAGRGVGSGKIKFGDTVFLDESRKGLAGQGAAL